MCHTNKTETVLGKQAGLIQKSVLVCFYLQLKAGGSHGLTVHVHCIVKADWWRGFDPRSRQSEGVLVLLLIKKKIRKTFYKCIVPMGFGKIGLVPGKTNCERVVLPNLQCMLSVSVFP